MSGYFSCLAKNWELHFGNVAIGADGDLKEEVVGIKECVHCSGVVFWRRLEHAQVTRSSEVLQLLDNLGLAQVLNNFSFN